MRFVIGDDASKQKEFDMTVMVALAKKRGEETTGPMSLTDFGSQALLRIRIDVPHQVRAAFSAGLVISSCVRGE